MCQQAHDDIVRLSHSPEETRGLGRSMGRHLEPGNLVCLYGELGAGKTTFIQGLAEGLGVEESPTSPSFTLIHEHHGRAPFYHLDLYRLTAADLPDIGVDEVMDSKAVVAVEWADRLPEELRRDALHIEMSFADGETARRIRFRASGRPASRALAALSEELDADART